jgi:hypothetical protein
MRENGRGRQHCRSRKKKIRFQHPENLKNCLKTAKTGLTVCSTAGCLRLCRRLRTQRYIGTSSQGPHGPTTVSGLNMRPEGDIDTNARGMVLEGALGSCTRSLGGGLDEEGL